MTNCVDFPPPAPSRPLWLVTLADLSLLLVGFFVLLQATAASDRRAIAGGLRQQFGAEAAASPPALPVAAAGILDFAPGSAAIPAGAQSLAAWAREAVRDPRVTLAVTGSTDGSPHDVDPATGSAAVLAADRARAVAVALADTVPAGRLSVATTLRPGRRAAIVTLAFAGEPARSH